MPDLEDAALARIIELAEQWSGCNFARYNIATLRRRIIRRMIDVRCHSMTEYAGHLDCHPAEYPRLVAALTIKVSCFFRDPEVFSFINERVLPAAIENVITAANAPRISAPLP